MPARIQQPMIQINPGYLLPSAALRSASSKLVLSRTVTLADALLCTGFACVRDRIEHDNIAALRQRCEKILCCAVDPPMTLQSEDEPIAVETIAERINGRLDLVNFAALQDTLKVMLTTSERV